MLRLVSPGLGGERRPLASAGYLELRSREAYLEFVRHRSARSATEGEADDIAVARYRGARRERKRIKAILQHPAAIGQEALAKRLAFTGNLSAREAISALERAARAAAARKRS